VREKREITLSQSFLEDSTPSPHNSLSVLSLFSLCSLSVLSLFSLSLSLSIPAFYPADTVCSVSDRTRADVAPSTHTHTHHSTRHHTLPREREREREREQRERGERDVWVWVVWERKESEK
jgi:hypothetical protein